MAYRVEDQCDLLYYFMQSVNFTPQWLSAFLNNLAEQTEHIRSHYSEDPELKAKQAHAVFRAGTIFPEMKNAAAWVESGSESMNNGIDVSVFDVLNLDYSGLTKVKRAYEIGDYYKALEEMLNYYRFAHARDESQRRPFDLDGYGQRKKVGRLCAQRERLPVLCEEFL